MNANLGHNPIFIWRSIFEAKQLIRDGVRWRVGNGVKIKVHGQHWLSTGENPYITTVSRVVNDINVASLMCTDKKEWDVDVICDVFNSRDQQRILDIQLEDAIEEDELFWHLESSGVYSVKSAYNLLQLQAGSWNMSDNSSVWRALSGCLPTLSQLQIKHVPIYHWCPVCNGEAETILHSLSRSNVALNQPQVEGDGASSWVRPQTNSVKVSTDAAIFEDRESVGFGLVARDSEGGLLEAKALVHHELLSPMLALSWIDRMQWNNVTLESDCLAVVQAIRSKAPMRARFGGVIKECYALVRGKKESYPEAT
ncbi:hypothetical protein AgCh_027728 [Apium graveolens]